MPAEDPCARAERLRAVRDALMTGQAVIETRYGDRAVRYAQADRAGLDREIAAAETACMALSGATPKRTRFARGARFRPY